YWSHLCCWLLLRILHPPPRGQEAMTEPGDSKERCCPKCGRFVGWARIAINPWTHRWPCKNCNATLRFSFLRDMFLNFCMLLIFVNCARAPIYIVDNPHEQYRVPHHEIVDHVNVSRAVAILLLIPVSFVALFVIGVVCEWLIRRRENRRYERK